ncbi:hypothetical protein QYE76_060255 [Lolium multiflorum]|uniref:F-box domain-containing protein n=1 Tax=Lolium multiflorum TaxID=4521 RepID=A0AAD8RYC0_LOLMU|nr:hypothetical protein QYE76_059589 [Lolium multiflorum]KAK1642450.1 hypothetical protein QYE76_060255 [Lolium multiflorum]
MEELAGDSRAADPPSLPDDLLVEILLRLPPEPIYLFRASFVSKHWRCLVHDARFLRRFRELHGRTPPVLGFFHPRGPPLFVPTSSGFAFSTATISCQDDCWLYDCRHGRALLDSYRTGTLLVLDLMTGDERYVPLPAQALGNMELNGAVLCAAGHADHTDCHSCPFLVAFVFSHQVDSVTSACLYSSETGAWGEIASIHAPYCLIATKPAALIGNILYWLLENTSILEFDKDKNSLDFVEEVPRDYDQIIIMPTEDGLLGFAGVDGFCLHLWSKVAGIDGVVTWTRIRVIDMEKLLAPEAVAACVVGRYGVDPIGYAEDADVIFVDVYPSFYMIHLKSLKIEEVPAKRICSHIFPYASFYAPGIMSGGGDDQDELLNSN